MCGVCSIIRSTTGNDEAFIDKFWNKDMARRQDKQTLP
jgi:hypothetical protein